MPSPMPDFMDLRGASGATYRFRVWPPNADHFSAAGNFVFLKKTPRGFGVLLVGSTHDLALLRAELKASGLAASHVLTRLNVARAVRHAEHSDLVAAYKPVMVREELT